MNNITPETQRERRLYSIWKNLPRLVVLILITLIVILFFILGDQKKELAGEKAKAKPPEQPPVNVAILTLAPAMIQERLNLPGAVEAWVDLNLLAKINGTIEEILVEEGQQVKKGTILAKIDDDDYRIGLDMAKASFQLAKSEYERDLSMFNKGIIASAELETKKTRMATSKSQLENAALLLSRCEILSPMDGIIRKMHAKPGLLLNVADPVADILQVDRVKAVVGIPESDVARVSTLTEIDLTIKALDNLKVTGKKHFFSPSPDSSARLYRLELAIDNSETKILPGMFIRANIVKQSIPDGMVIPLYAVISRGDLHFVYVERDGVSHKKEVSLGFLEGWKVLVKDGLNPGDRVIVEGQRSVEDGQKVKVIHEVEEMGEILP
ncbi:MAG: efflux RND transporter periplasmic adaptor subunit [Thermodesulfobacteriota bacterium]